MSPPPRQAVGARNAREARLGEDGLAQIRALPDFCGLPVEGSCLDFHTVQRAIRPPIALQVRPPTRRTSIPGAACGALRDPLRQRLAR